jgi:hypothetical protein
MVPIGVSRISSRPGPCLVQQMVSRWSYSSQGRAAPIGRQLGFSFSLRPGMSGRALCSTAQVILSVSLSPPSSSRGAGSSARPALAGEKSSGAAVLADTQTWT